MPSRKLFTEKAPTARASVKPGREARLKFRSLRRERHTILLTIRTDDSDVVLFVVVSCVQECNPAERAVG